MAIQTNSQPLNIITNKLHAKVFADTWQYDKTLLKEYYIDFKIKYVPGGGEFRRGLYEYAYTLEEAAQLAFKRLKLRKEDKLLEVRPVCINTAKESR